MPKDVESWYQEMGRAGRDGLDSDCILFYSWADVKMHERFLSDIEDPDLWHAKRQATVFLFNLLESGRCRHRAILSHFDERMEGCENSCDVCTGVTVEELAGRSGGIGRLGVTKSASRKKRRRTQPIGGGTAETGSIPPPAPDPAQQDLFETLRARRKELADAQRVPAYIVFSDKVLWELAVRKPSTSEEMLQVPGIGPAKLERYGSAFLELLRSHRSQ
jgi:ATP-dependent DNA helicase RecQ